jgi:hypothetical protein
MKLLARIHIVVSLLSALTALAADSTPAYLQPHVGSLVTAGGPYSTTLIGTNSNDAAETVLTVDCVVAPAAHLTVPGHGVGIRYNIETDRCGSSVPIQLLDVSTNLTLSTRLTFDVDGITQSSFVVPLLETKLDDYVKTLVLAPVVNNPAALERAYIAVWNRSSTEGTLTITPLDTALHPFTTAQVETVKPGLTFIPVRAVIAAGGGLQLQQVGVVVAPQPPPVVLMGFVVWGQGHGSQWVVPF